MTTPVNAFTVDLEDWFQGLTSTNPLVERWPEFESRVVEATQRLLKLLHANNVSATFFVLGYVADQFPQLIEEIYADGHEIAIHGYFHRFVYRLTAEEFDKEITRSIAAVEKITGERPLGHRAPYFSVNRDTPWFSNVLADQGLKYDSSVFPIKNMLYGFPEAPRFPYRLPNGMMEFPASTANFWSRRFPVAGGFYVRALPYAFIRKAIQSLQRQGQPAIMYVHPWELDLGQHYDQVTMRERVTHYYGRRGLSAKLQRLFTDFRFGPMRELLGASRASEKCELETEMIMPSDAHQVEQCRV